MTRLRLMTSSSCVALRGLIVFARDPSAPANAMTWGWRIR